MSNVNKARVDKALLRKVRDENRNRLYVIPDEILSYILLLFSYETCGFYGNVRDETSIKSSASRVNVFAISS